jgi:hypothetical protein
MSDRRRAGTGGQGSVVRGFSRWRIAPNDRLAPAGRAVAGSRSAAPRLLKPTLWLVALLGCLVLAAPARAQESAAQRQQRIESMSPAAKRELLRQQEKFDALPLAEQERLRELHRQLSDPSNPDAPALRRVLHEYSEWLKTLSTADRRELLDLAPAERIERIKQVQNEQIRQPKPEDVAGLFRWARQYAADPAHHEDILKGAPDFGRRRFAQKDPREKNWAAVQIMRDRLQVYYSGRPPEWNGWRENYWGSPAGLTDAQLADLRAELSESTRRQLEKMPADQQWEVIGDWFRYSTGFGFSSRRMADWLSPQERAEWLDQSFIDEFFEGLPEQQQEWLLNLPPDDMQRALEQMYVAQFFDMSGGIGPGFGGGYPGGGPPGGRGGRQDGRDDRRPDARGGGPPGTSSSMGPSTGPTMGPMLGPTLGPSIGPATGQLPGMVPGSPMGPIPGPGGPTQGQSHSGSNPSGDANSGGK